MRVLIIDDESTHRKIYRIWLEKFTVLEVEEASNTKDGFNLILQTEPTCILMDYMMQKEDGYQALHRIKKCLFDCPPIIIMTSALSDELRSNALALGAFACIDKGKITGDLLCEKVQDAVRHKLNNPNLSIMCNS